MAFDEIDKNIYGYGCIIKSQMQLEITCNHYLKNNDFINKHLEYQLSTSYPISNKNLIFP